MGKNSKISIHHITILAFAVCINLIGGQIALMLKLPIYLDSIGTMFIGALLGPVYGMLPNLLSGIIFGMTTDIYSLYYAPVGMLIGLMCGLVFHKRTKAIWWPLLAALIVTVPGTIVSSLITAFLFGGITSSGSSILMQLLSKTGLGMTASVFIVQFFTDYLDRIIGIVLVIYLLKVLPSRMLGQIKNKE